MQPVMKWGGGEASLYLLPKAPLLFSECSSVEESQKAHAWGSEWMKDMFTHITENFKAKLMDNCQGLFGPADFRLFFLHDSGK